MENNKIYTNHTLEEYNKKYGNKNLKKITKADAVKDPKLLEKHSWCLINDTYYEVPSNKIISWWNNLSGVSRIVICSAAGVGVVSAVVFPTLAATVWRKTAEPTIDIQGQGVEYDKAASHIELNKDSYIAIKENSVATIIDVTEVKIDGKVLTRETDWTYANKKISIKAHAMTSTKIEIKVKTRMPTTNIDWATKKVDGTNTLYDLAKTATSIKFIKSDDTTSGTLCGEGDDKVYYTFESNVLTVWAKDKIAFKDNDLAEEGSYGLFYECGEVTSIDTSNIDTYELTNFDDCFGSCKKLKDLDVTNIDTSSATTFQFMFYECEELTSLDLRCFDTKNVTDIGRMFYGCKKLTNLDVTSFDTSKVTAMFGTFSMCPLLTTLDLSSFDTSKVTTTSIMFSGDSELTTIYASNKFDISQLGQYMHDNMFDSCTKLKGGKGTTYNGGIIDKTRAKIDGGPGNEGYFTEKK